jgi:hypothetical protein
MEYVGIFYGHWVYLMKIWYILWTFGIFCVILVHFTPLWYGVPNKSGNPGFDAEAGFTKAESY